MCLPYSISRPKSYEYDAVVVPVVDSYTVIK